MGFWELQSKILLNLGQLGGEKDSCMVKGLGLRVRVEGLRFRFRLRVSGFRGLGFRVLRV